MADAKQGAGVWGVGCLVSAGRAALGKPQANNSSAGKSETMA